MTAKKSDAGFSLSQLVKATESLKTAQQLLSKFIVESPQDIELHKALRDSCIQRLEFCVELSWKTSIKILGLNTKSPNVAIRDMAQNAIIDDPQIWFDFLIARNRTSHTYAEDVAKQVFEEVARLVPELDKLIQKLEAFQP